MDGVSQISEFGKIFIFLITGMIMVGLAFFVTRLLAPKNPTPEKLTSYECGEEPVGSAWIPFNSRFYVIALVFLLFEVEMVFVLPWATVFGNKTLNSADGRWGWFSLIEMFIFLGILVLGLAYVWVKGDLDWIKPRPVTPAVDSQVPVSFYERLNLQQNAYTVKEFKAESEQVPTENTVTASGTATSPRPAFKPMFKKPGNES
ncbi:MAG: NADH-quinone oxidoreductase subunit A [Bacteroidetes bacterium]|nr:NADH-quinone oxidoreductase subunit A [Bacteroidota bacterium]